MVVVPKPGSSMERVVRAAEAAGLAIDLKVMDRSTRTAQEAADACGCAVDQIVKSLVFDDAASGALVLVLVSGGATADLDHLERTQGLRLRRAEGRRVRDETGFAIGGVAPLGHLRPIPVYMDETLLRFESVWAAAGRPASVFCVDPKALALLTDAKLISVTP